jgi:hypothetical protein
VRLRCLEPGAIPALSEQRERKVKTLLGARLEGAFLAPRNEPQSVRVWRTGSEGEKRLARILESRESRGLALRQDHLPSRCDFP